jgi:hypothetical protein
MTTWAEEPATPATQIWDEALSGAGAWDPSPQATQDELMNSPDKVRDLLSAAGFTPEAIWIERLEYRWRIPRFMGLRTGFGATKRKLETLDVRTRQVCLDRIKEQVSHLRPRDLVCRGAAICATATAGHSCA